MAKMQIADGIISSSADYSLYHGTTKVADVRQDEIRVQGDLIAENYIVSSSTTYVTTSFSDGSTKFGNDVSDTHQFSGSVSISGSHGTTVFSVGDVTTNTYSKFNNIYIAKNNTYQGYIAWGRYSYHTWEMGGADYSSYIAFRNYRNSGQRDTFKFYNNGNFTLNQI